MLQDWYTIDEVSRELGVSYSRTLRAIKAQLAGSSPPIWVRQINKRLYLVRKDGLEELRAKLIP